MSPLVLARLRDVPTRAFAAALTFGAMLGVPALLFGLAIAAFAVGGEVAGVILLLLSVLVFIAAVVAAWVFILKARSGLKRAEQALYAGDFETATRSAHFVVRTVFRSDYQLGALFTLALTAERIGAFAEAGPLFVRALDMMPAMSATLPGRRARALITAHAAIGFAAANDPVRANAMLARCHAELGASGQPGALEFLIDDSSFGAVGLNSMLVEIENRREPRPLAVLASLLVAYKSGRIEQAMHMFEYERASIEHGLAPHERALAERIRSEAARALAGGGPHRAPAALALSAHDLPATWAAAILPPS